VWLNRLESEHGNLRAALRWALDQGEDAIALRLGAALWRFWLVRGHLIEGRQWLENILAATDPSVVPAVRAQALNAVGTFAHNQGDNRKARKFLQDGLRRWRALDDEQGQATVLNNLAWVACEISALDEAQALAEEGLALCRTLGDRRGEAVALNNLGWVAHYRGAFLTASRLHQESLVVRRTLKDHRGAAFARINAAWAETYLGHYDHAAALLEDAWANLRAIKDVQEQIWWLFVSGNRARHAGRLDQAENQLSEGLALWADGGNRSLRALLQGALGRVRIEQERLGEARSQLNESLELWNTVGSPWGIAAVTCALGHCAWASSDEEQAEARYRDSWSLRHEIGDRHGTTECLEALGTIAMAHHPSQAVRLFAAAQALRQAIEAPLPHLRRERWAKQLDQLRDTLAAAAFERAWSAGTAASPAQLVGELFT
jgi:tetratricopeptide (TPR) repeat protein